MKNKPDLLKNVGVDQKLLLVIPKIRIKKISK